MPSRGLLRLVFSSINLELACANMHFLYKKRWCLCKLSLNVYSLPELELGLFVFKRSFLDIRNFMWCFLKFRNYTFLTIMANSVVFQTPFCICKRNVSRITTYNL